MPVCRTCYTLCLQPAVHECAKEIPVKPSFLILSALGLLLLYGCSDSDAGTVDGDGTENGYRFEEYAYLDQKPDVTQQRMCAEAADPEGAAEKIFIDCGTEGASFAPAGVPAKQDIVIMAYNIERGFKIDEQIDAILHDDAVPVPDIILVSEADRGCNRTDKRYVLWDYAQQLQMNFVYGVEFTELNRVNGLREAECEHGNGILSRYPIGNVRVLRHETQASWWDDESEPRLGGRMAISADIKIGDTYITVYALHFESHPSEDYRSAQALEIAEDGLNREIPAIAGGDTNAAFYGLDLQLETTTDETIKQFIQRGWYDSHVSIDPELRATAPDSGFILDLILGTDDGFSAPGICPEATCGSLSDHLPVWATYRLP